MQPITLERFGFKSLDEIKKNTNNRPWNMELLIDSINYFFQIFGKEITDFKDDDLEGDDWGLTFFGDWFSVRQSESETEPGVKTLELFETIYTPATYWEPGDYDVSSIGKANNEIEAAEKFARHYFITQIELGSQNLYEGLHWESDNNVLIPEDYFNAQ